MLRASAKWSFDPSFPVIIFIKSYSFSHLFRDECILLYAMYRCSLISRFVSYWKCFYKLPWYCHWQFSSSENRTSYVFTRYREWRSSSCNSV